MTDDYPEAKAYIDTDEHVLHTEVKTADGTTVSERSVNLNYEGAEEVKRAVAGQANPLLNVYAVELNGEQEEAQTHDQAPEELDDIEPDG
jgi:hypothetical protein